MHPESKRAVNLIPLINTGNNDIEAAMNWVFEHQSDPDFDTPYQAPSKKARVEQTQTPPVSYLLLQRNNQLLAQPLQD